LLISSLSLPDHQLSLLDVVTTGLTYREIHYVCEELALSERLVGMDLVEVNPALESVPPPAEPLHGDNPMLKPTTPTVQLAVELVLSALGKTIL
jgi:arginase family enzyme